MKPEKLLKKVIEESKQKNKRGNLTQREIEELRLLVKEFWDYKKKDSSEEMDSFEENLTKRLEDNLGCSLNKISTEEEEKEVVRAIIKSFLEAVGVPQFLRETGKRLDFDSVLSLTLRSVFERKKIPFRLEPTEKNLINLPIWYPSTKGLSQNPEVKTLTIKKGDLQIEYDYQLSLPTVFTFEVFSILCGIWKDQGYPNIFYTSLGEICRRKGMPNASRNRKLVLTALRQLHNTRICAPFWEINAKGEKRETIWKINILVVVGERIRAGKKHTLELEFNPHIRKNIRNNHFQLLDHNLLNKLRSPVAKRLYSLIEQYPSPYQKKLSTLKEILNIRDRHAKQTIERASEKLVEIGYLEKFKIERGKKVNGLVYRAYKAEEDGKG